jgi:hypothetical protein
MRLAPLSLLLILSAWSFPDTSTRADEPMLQLTDEEFEANLDFRERSAALGEKHTNPSAPRIVVSKPDIDSDVAAPVEIEVRFEVAEDASIDLDTLRIHYGWFDITNRVLESMQVSRNGIEGRISSARLGRYSLRISVKDSKKREGKANIVFEIVAST